MCSVPAQSGPDLRVAVRIAAAAVRDRFKMAVLAFFVISGVIVVAAAERFYLDAPARFLANRFVRIFPAYLTILLISYLVLAPFAYTGTLVSHEGHPAPTDSHSIVNLAATFLRTSCRRGVCPSFSFLEIVRAVRTEFLFYCVVFAALLAAKRAAWASRRICSRQATRADPALMFRSMLTAIFADALLIYESPTKSGRLPFRQHQVRADLRPRHGTLLRAAAALPRGDAAERRLFRNDDRKSSASRSRTRPRLHTKPSGEASALPACSWPCCCRNGRAVRNGSTGPWRSSTPSMWPSCCRHRLASVGALPDPAFIGSCRASRDRRALLADPRSCRRVAGGRAAGTYRGTALDHPTVALADRRVRHARPGAGNGDGHGAGRRLAAGGFASCRQSTGMGEDLRVVRP